MIRIVGLDFEIGGRKILRGVNLNVDRGETVAVMGMSGVGKSTLLKCAAGLSLATAGDIFLDEVNITEMRESKLNDIRRYVGMVFQYAALFDSMNVYENVSFGARRHMKMTEQELKEMVKEKLSTVGLSNIEELMPSELSGGMQKRVGLARALAMEPKVLLYDEPTAGLDPIMAGAIASLISKMRDELGVASLLVSHDLPTIMAASNRIAMLHAGRIIAIGTAEEMLESTDPYVRQFMSGSAEGPIKTTP